MTKSIQLPVQMAFYDDRHDAPRNAKTAFGELAGCMHFPSARTETVRGVRSLCNERSELNRTVRSCIFWVVFVQ